MLARSNIKIRSEDRAILAIAGFVCFISLLDSAARPRQSPDMVGPTLR